MTLTIELMADSGRTPPPCAKCGKPTTDARGFVHRDGDAHAIYFASWSECAPLFVKLAVVMGQWDEGAAPADRRAIGMDAEVRNDQIHLTVTSEADSPWADVSIVGRMLDRDEALSDPDIDEVFHITEHVTSEDPRIAEWLDESVRDS